MKWVRWSSLCTWPALQIPSARDLYKKSLDFGLHWLRLATSRLPLTFAVPTLGQTGPKTNKHAFWCMEYSCHGGYWPPCYARNVLIGLESRW